MFFAFGIIFCSTANVMVQHPFMMGVMHMGMKMRVGVCSLIYRKVTFRTLVDFIKRRRRLCNVFFSSRL